MKKILIGNWKMNPKSATIARKIVSDVKKSSAKSKAEIVICPPAPFIHLIGGKIKRGAQDVSVEKEEGAFTGEVSANQLKSIGASYAIVGHSERRARGETSLIVAKKAFAALASSISPLICIGEKERHHDGSHWSEIKKQMHESLKGVKRAQISKCIIVYEPVWAISTHNKGVMRTEDVNESSIFVRKVLAEMFGSKLASKTRIIYGGSVDAKNAPELAEVSGISGVLVGRASLKGAEFAKIVSAFS
ncbi:MAG TPA: triose-phosphate isomerase [Candidatus Paceibacterota bacterium]